MFTTAPPARRSGSSAARRQRKYPVRWTSSVRRQLSTGIESSEPGSAALTAQTKDRKSTRLKLQSLAYLVCRLLLEKKTKPKRNHVFLQAANQCLIPRINGP